MTTRTAIALRFVGALAIVVGLLDTGVLLPLTLAPTTGIGGTWVAIAEAGELGWVVPWPLLWTALAVTALLALDRPVRFGRLGAGRLLLVLGGLAFGFCLSQFALALWISNHLPPYEGGDSLTGGTSVSDVGLLVAVMATAGGLLRLAMARAHRASF